MTVYGGRSHKLLRAITQGIAYPTDLALDLSGHLYVSNEGEIQGTGSVNEYALKGTKEIRALTRRLTGPFRIVLDGLGNLYALDQTSVVVYEHANSKRVYRIPVRGYALAVDASNNLYVSTLFTVKIYAPGSRTPSRTITDGVDEADAFAFDSAGNLYVANGVGGAYNCGTVTVYAPGSDSILYTINATKEICGPLRVAIDSANNLYVASGEDTFPGAVDVFAAGTSTLLRTISQGINGPEALAFDRSGDLYVANYNGNTVTVYAPGSSSVLQTISEGISYPAALAVWQ